MLTGITLLLASLVCFCMFPRTWLGRWWAEGEAKEGETVKTDKETETVQVANSDKTVDTTDIKTETDATTLGAATMTNASARAAMPPPPLIVQTADGDEEEDEPTTPRATPALSLPDADSPDTLPPPMFPALHSAQRAGGGRPSSMAPPSTPSVRLMAPSPTSTPSRRLPVPDRRPASASLAPPPTTTRLTRAARQKVALTPGHSPLDWARLTADPHADLRRLPPDTPALLRVTPSQLRTMNGRRGRDAWTALGGMVYNLTPYVPFHPGGAGELLRCAGRDGNRLFQQVHAWVNYDNMLAACRVGILVEEHEAVSPMEEMD